MVEDKNELEITQAEFSQDSEEVAKFVDEQKMLVPYVAKSKAPFKLKTVVPKNMAFEIQRSLENVVSYHGNIDSFVRNELKYSSNKNLWDALAAEQVDSLGLYLHQFYNEKGIIIADQTGVGKGRQAAGVIRHAVMQGYLPIFFTKAPDLFTDIYRDLKAIGFVNINPFIVNTTSNARIKDQNGNVVFTPLSSEAQWELIADEQTYAIDSPESIAWHKEHNKKLPDPETTPYITISDSIDHLPKGYDMIFTSYSQIQSAHHSKRDWLKRLTMRGVEGSKNYKKVILILDESHLAGGYDSIIGIWMRDLLDHVKACCDLSATFAKYPEVMPLYAKKTSISETRLSDDAFVDSMKRGGLALQEIVASNLAESGQLIRRQRSNEGVEVKYLMLDNEPQQTKNREKVNRITKLMNDIVRFEDDYILPILDAIQEQVRKEAGRNRGKTRSLGVKSAPFTSRVFNTIDQMLFALKAEEVAAQALKYLKNDKKVVIAFKSTMGSHLKSLNYTNGDIVAKSQLEFAKILLKSLESVFHYNFTSVDGVKTRERIELTELPPSGYTRYLEIKEQINLEETGLSISPIDVLIHRIESAEKPDDIGGHSGSHFIVSEVTGRNQRIDFSDPKQAVVRSNRKNIERSFRLFNNGDYDVLLINQSGSTGYSAHASKNFKDQRQRWMFIHQFEVDIYVEIQKRGRTGRTNEVVPPGYLYLTSTIPIEKRQMTMLKGKLKSLDANTTGSQKTNDNILDSPDFFNKYGDIVAWNWITKNYNLMEVLGYPGHYRVRDKYGDIHHVRNDDETGVMRQLTGRAGLLQVDKQEQLYNELLADYQHLIKIEKQNGTYDLEVEFLKLDADVRKRFLFIKGRGGKTPFGKDTIREYCIINNLDRPLLKQEIDERIEKILDGEKPSQIRIGIETTIEERYPDIIEEKKQARQQTIDRLKKEREELPELGSGLTDEEAKKIKANIEKLDKLINRKETKLEQYVQELKDIQEIIQEFLGIWEIGDTVLVPVIGGFREAAWGIFLGVNFQNKGKNPFRLGNFKFQFAVADYRKIVEYNLTENDREYLRNIELQSRAITQEQIQSVAKEWNDYIHAASKKREARHILTENVIRPSGIIGSKNKLIKYNTKDGVIKNGILMHVEFNKDEFVNKSLLPISEAKDLIFDLVKEEIFTDHSLAFRVKRISVNYYQVYLAKKVLYKAAIDTKLRSLLHREEDQSADELPDFVQNAMEMTGVVHIDNMEAFLIGLSDFDVKYYTDAEELEDWEQENEASWRERTKKKEGEIFKYKLGRAFGQDSNPNYGFDNYIEPTSQASNDFGYVTYHRALSAKEKYNYSLTPVFSSAEEPYKKWKAYISASNELEEVEKLIKKASKLPLHKAIEMLGYYILRNLHEDGNAEYVVGSYTAIELGRVFYEDTIAEIDQIDELISQLTIAKIA